MKTIVNPNDKDTNGISYYMPMKDLMITIKTKADKAEIDTITIATTQAYPDYSKQYVLKYSRNMFGKSIMDFSLTPTGLLSITKSTNVSSANQTFKNLASTSVYLTNKQGKNSNCLKNRSYVYIIKMDDSTIDLPCDLKYTIGEIKNDIKANSDSKNLKDASNPASSSFNKIYSGVFYKQEVSHLITISETTTNFTFKKIVTSPSLSEIHYFPFPKGFFANNKSELTLDNGVLTRAFVETEAELTAALKLPADIIASYFDAVAGIFTKKTAVNTNESNYIKSQNDIEFLKIKRELCRNAIEAKDDALIQANCVAQ